MRRGEEIRIAAKDLTCLVRWMPSLKKSIDDLPDDCLGWGFVFFQRLAGLERGSGPAFAAVVCRV
ncbi:hypothetical protein ABZ467_33450 [Streptomyces sp. NPDC005727]|uniref:hypothetical protein n=1 Tax=Streptomyces sp. NPDC005727 TaxID=3157053 RepID=UPI0033BFF223